ncbi:MAG: glycerol-3-phosphate 1-O-acyltransferase PlsY [Gammaproteobacteria bacterium]|nr:glycerol-3-phosphate 1-O-acyltransferase PlsY [Gammaproteobacteria bacterium]MCW5582427.1 glycerol-3-phosphate 1-O-acyltransferase PlsY [Gammaproteobacteria bacterium]
MSYVDTVVATLIAYLIGSISSAIIVCKLMQLPDPRTQGSHNPGATNVLRIGGKKAAIFTLLGDLLKGLIPVAATKWLGFDAAALAFITFAAFLGHLFPLFFRFEGGKGVATALGCLLALNWPTGLCWVTTWAIVALLFRYSSLSSLVASLLAPIYLWYFTNNFAWTTVSVLMSIILIIRHRGNIAKLVKGEESKIGK